MRRAMIFCALVAISPTARAAVDVGAVQIKGVVTDVFPAGLDATWLAVSRSDARFVVDTRGKVVARAPDDAVFVDACEGHGVVFATPRGIVDNAGKLLLGGDALFRLADRDRLIRYPLCAREAPGELFLLTRAGLVVGAAGTPGRLHAFAPQPRAYGGADNAGRGRPYGAAVSVYAPHILEVNLDADDDTELVLIHDRRMSVFDRQAGKLVESPHLVDLAALTGASGADDLRVFADGEALVVVRARGLIPKRTVAHRIENTLTTPKATLLFDRDRYVVVLDATRGLYASLDTSLVAMGAVLVTGRLPLVVEGTERELSLDVAADASRGRIEGALPIIAVDVDGDGAPDLIDLGRPGVARLFRAEAQGFGRQPTQTWKVPSPEIVFANARGLVIVGPAVRGKTEVMSLRAR